MKTFSKWLKVISFTLLCFGVWPAQAQVLAQPLQMEKPLPVLVTNPPVSGTFYWLYKKPALPYPFDPSFGLLPIYLYDGVYFVDDSQPELFSLGLEFGGGGMEMMSGPSPGGGGGTNSGATNLFCNGATNFTLAYGSSTSGVWLRLVPLGTNTMALTLHTTDASFHYDLYGSTNMAPLALPQLSKTNWVWLLRASNASLSFVWGQSNWCESWFQLGTMQDSDSDGLTDAYENLVSHTDKDDADTDDDSVSDYWEVVQGRNPRSSNLIADTGNVLGLRVFTPLK